ncbi:MAG: hypothetical protein ACFNUO_04455 [Capnocytophaga ochracea]
MLSKWGTNYKKCSSRGGLVGRGSDSWEVRFTRAIEGYSYRKKTEKFESELRVILVRNGR